MPPCYQGERILGNRFPKGQAQICSPTSRNQKYVGLGKSLWRSPQIAPPKPPWTLGMLVSGNRFYKRNMLSYSRRYLNMLWKKLVSKTIAPITFAPQVWRFNISRRDERNNYIFKCFFNFLYPTGGFCLPRIWERKILGRYSLFCGRFLQRDVMWLYHPRASLKGVV